MKSHLDIRDMAAKAFDRHAIGPARSKSWRVAKPGTWTYGFLVTWTPCAITIVGDLGEASWTGFTYLGHPYEAAHFLAGCDYHYLLGKARVAEVFDRDESVAHLLDAAETERKEGWGLSIWKCLVDHYGEWDDKPQLQKSRVRAGCAFRADSDLSAEQIYRLSGHDCDSGYAVMSPPSHSRWQYEALMVWARLAVETEPLSSKMQRALRRFRRWREDLRRYPIVMPAAIYEKRSCSPATWIKTETCWRAISPFKLFGKDLSVWGLWRIQGSSTPVGGEREGEYTLRNPFAQHSHAVPA